MESKILSFCWNMLCSAFGGEHWILISRATLKVSFKEFENKKHRNPLRKFLQDELSECKKVKHLKQCCGPTLCFHRTCSHSGSLVLIYFESKSRTSISFQFGDTHLVELRRDSANAQVTATWENITAHSSV